MIALTPEMRAAACRRMGVDDLDPWMVAALVDVLALVERDYDVAPKLPPIEHRMARAPYWNHYHAVFGVECTCGEEFSAYTDRDAQWRLEDHIAARSDD